MLQKPVLFQQILLAAGLCGLANFASAKPLGVKPLVVKHWVDTRAVALLDKAARSYVALGSIAMTVQSQTLMPLPGDATLVEFAWARPNLFRVLRKAKTFEILSLGDGKRWILSDGTKVNIHNLVWNGELSAKIALQNAEIGKAPYGELALLPRLLAGKNALRERLAAGPDLFFQEARFLKAKMVDGQMCEGLIWREKIAGLVDAPLRIEWTTWFDAQSGLLRRVQTRWKFDRHHFTATRVDHIQTRENSVFSPDFFQFTPPENALVQTFGAPNPLK